MTNAPAETRLMILGFIKRAISSEPMIISIKEQKIKAQADPNATHSTYFGLSLARSRVVICVLSPISERKTTPSAEKNKRHSNFKNALLINQHAPHLFLALSCCLAFYPQEVTANKKVSPDIHIVFVHSADGSISIYLKIG